MSVDESKKFVKRLFLGTVSFRCDVLSYPSEDDINDEEPAGRNETDYARRVDLADLKKRPESSDAELCFDGGLCFIYSKKENSILFSSNVGIRRIEKICRELRAHVVMFSHRNQRNIMVHVMAFTRDDFLKEIDDEYQELQKSVAEFMKKMNGH